MNLVFVCGTHLDCNSGVHIFNLANHLAALGHQCVVAVAECPEATHALGKADFTTIAFDALDGLNEAFADRQAPTLLHAWTPRENVRRAVEQAQARFACPYFVHLEDNEEHLTQTRLGLPMDDLLRLDVDELDAMVPPHAAHPLRHKAFLAGATGVTAVIDTLFDFKPEAVPGLVFWPGFDTAFEWSVAPDPVLRREFGLRPDEHIVAYNGNAHHANRREVASLYLAVGLLNRRGLPVRLLRTGVDTAPLFDARGAAELAPYVVELGFVARPLLPGILALADVAVQPGGPGSFNDYRFPSKLPEYFAAGRAVVLPKCNLGNYLENHGDAHLSGRGDAMDLAQVLESILPDPAYRAHLGARARAFAERHFRWADIAVDVDAFYRDAVGMHSQRVRNRPPPATRSRQ